ncbi:MAG TPA: hypothetical protein VM689_19030 [Aliidongia sp.]|nr:hypothetical protein [Aliidongia sp.]
MKYLVLGAGVALGLYATAAAAETPLMAPIHQFIDSFDKGDEKTAAKAFAPGGVAIIDEVAPHLWTGAHALQQWSKDLMADSGKEGLTDESVTLGTPTREDVNGDRGYLVVPATFAFKQKGAAMSEAAQMVVALKQSGGHWLITGWAWAGGTPQPATAAAK